MVTTKDQSVERDFCFGKLSSLSLKVETEPKDCKLRAGLGYIVRPDLKRDGNNTRISGLTPQVTNDLSGWDSRKIKFPGHPLVFV